MPNERIKSWVISELEVCDKEDYQYRALLNCLNRVLAAIDARKISIGVGETIIGNLEKTIDKQLEEERENKEPLGFIIPVELTFSDE